MEHPEAGSRVEEFSEKLSPSEALKEYGSQIDTISFCASPSDQPAKIKRRSKNSKAEDTSLGGMIRRAVFNHQLGLSLNLMIFVALTYVLFPSLRSRVAPFFQVQYAQPSGLYIQGPEDAGIVAGFVVFFTALRAIVMDYLLMPFAKSTGIKKKKTQLRFAEQSYLLLYYIVIWSWGVKLFVDDTPSSSATTVSGWVDDLLQSLWRDFPRLTLSASMKLYYLIQSAFWFAQVLVIHLEERRNDHYQMLAHHFITIGLLMFSYGFRQMRVGNAILILMDAVDLVFPLAKCLRYVGLQTACDIAFGVFVIVWLLARHLSYCTIIYSIVVHAGVTTMQYGKYNTVTGALISHDGGSNILDNLLQPLLNPTATTVSFNYSIRSVFITLLGGLQVITCIWFAMICRVVARVLRGEGADDSRSDDEEEVEIDEKDLEQDLSSVERNQDQKFIEITTDAEELHYARPVPNNSSSRMSVPRRKSKGISSSLNLGEHKDILNRIGCLSEEQLARERERRQESSSPQPGSSKRF